ncbi:MAG: peptidase, partial [Gemmatimonadaceae bacterium]|nr:peptidase [Gemmatimonadaceae bacterium]
MFEPQDHPNDFRFPGAPPTPPYDNAGYTLALQMGVKFDRILDGFGCPCERIEPSALVKPAAGTVANGGRWVISPAQNDAFTAVARLLKGGVDVTRLANGDFSVPANGKSRPIVTKAATELGVTFAAATGSSAGTKVTLPRIGLWDRYGGSMPSGHTRWLLEKFGYDYTLVYASDLDAGNLRAKYDVLVFVDGAIPGRVAAGAGEGFGGAGPDTATLPPEWRKTVARVTAEKTVPQLKAFMEAGGRVITIGSSTALADHLGLPIDNYLMEGGKRLPQEKYYVPGSLLEVRYDASSALARGAGETGIVVFDNSPVFKLGSDAAAKGVKRVAWFEKAPLRSGWAWGEQYLEGGTAIAEAAVGQGTLYLFGPEVLFRGQPHATFRLFFNALTGAK